MTDDRPERRGWRQWSPTWLLAVVGLLVVGGTVLRFATFTSEPGSARAPAVPRTIEERIAALEQRVEATPTAATSWRALGLAYTRRATQLGDPSFYELARDALDRAEQLAPDDPAVALARGRLALGLHDFAEALQLGRRALEGIPKSPEALGVIVDAHVELGHYERAARRLQDMLDVRPGLPALSRTSYLRELNGDLEGATDAMRQAVAAGQPDGFETAQTGALLGDLHLAAGRLEAAADAYGRALEAAPELIGAQVGLAHIEAARGRREAAIERLEELTAATPAPRALILLGDLQQAAGRSGAAEDSFAVVRSIIRLQREAGQTVDLELALFEADHDRPKRALELARQANRTRPDNIYVADALAWALYRSGDPGAAAAHLDRALRLGTADPLLHLHAAFIHDAVGNRDRARTHLRRVAETNPWVSFSLLPEAHRLGDRLDVDIPARPEPT